MRQNPEVSSVRVPQDAPAVGVPDLRVIAASVALLAGGVFFIRLEINGTQALLYLMGAALGLILYHSVFGFAGAWRSLIVDRRGAGLRAHMLLLALTTLLLLPPLAAGSLFGRPVTGNVAPVGLGVFIGAFLFGVGMQLGGG